MGTDVKIFHSGQVGAPVLSGTAGALASLLDACLVNGFGLGQLDSLVIAGGVATATRAAGHSQAVGTVVHISGATVSGGSVGGEYRVLTSTVAAFTFATPGVTDQTAGGTILAKLAPAGWAKPFASGNVAAFQPTDTGSSRPWLRVDDAGTTTARVVGYEAMSDLNTGDGPFPTAAQSSGGGYWVKSNTASSAARPWVLFADSGALILAVSGNNGTTFGTVGFGDLVSFKTPDAYRGFLQCLPSDLSSSSPGSLDYDLDYCQATTTGGVFGRGMFVARGYNGIGASALMRRPMPMGAQTSAYFMHSGETGTGWQYPNGPDGGLYVAPVPVAESASLALRGMLPGLLFSPQAIGSGVFSHLEPVTSVNTLTGRTLRAINTASGVYFVDATGPWR